MNTTTKAVGMDRNIFRGDFWPNATSQVLIIPSLMNFTNSTLSAVKSNVFFEKFKVKSNGKKSEVQRVLDFTFFTVGLHFLLK